METTYMQDENPQVDESLEVPHIDVINLPAKVSPTIGPFWRSNRPMQQPRRYEDLVLNARIGVILENDELATYKQAITDTNSQKWPETMKYEMDSMFENQMRLDIFS